MQIGTGIIIFTMLINTSNAKLFKIRLLYRCSFPTTIGVLISLLYTGFFIMIITGYIYIIDAEPYSDKYYIGLTTKTLKQRLAIHKGERNKKSTVKNNWINKYLKHLNISELEVIHNSDINLLIKDLQYWEMFYIALFKSWNIQLLNYTNGGDGYKAFHSKETKELLSNLATGKKRGCYNWTREGKDAIKEGRKKLIGRTHSKETKIKMGEWQKGEKNNSFGKTPINVIRTCGKPVLCITTGQKFPSMKNAAKITGYDESTIRNQCNLTSKAKNDNFQFSFISKEEYYAV